MAIVDLSITNVCDAMLPILQSMRPKGTQEQLERRRRQAVALNQKGLGPVEIARRLNTTPQSVCRWLRAYRRGGEKALVAKPVLGRPSKLTARQRRGLQACLVKGATAFGFATDLWTSSRIAQLIEQRYGVRYHTEHIPKLLRRLGLSASKTRTSRRRTRRKDGLPPARKRTATLKKTQRSSYGSV